MIGMIWAQSGGRVIGNAGAMPWQLPEDARHFRDVTTGHTVLMGRKTWDSLPERFRPLPGRANVVITTQPTWEAAGAQVAHSLPDALAAHPQCWIIGGAALYEAGLAAADRLEVTEIDHVFDGDTYAPVIGPQFLLVATGPWSVSAHGLRYRFLSYAQPSTSTST